MTCDIKEERKGVIERVCIVDWLFCAVPEEYRKGVTSLGLAHRQMVSAWVLLSCGHRDVRYSSPSSVQHNQSM